MRKCERFNVYEMDIYANTLSFITTISNLIQFNSIKKAFNAFRNHVDDEKRILIAQALLYHRSMLFFFFKLFFIITFQCLVFTSTSYVYTVLHFSISFYFILLLLQLIEIQYTNSFKCRQTTCCVSLQHEFVDQY